MAPLAGAAGRLHPCGSGADDDDPLRRVGLRGNRIGLPPQVRVDRTADVELPEDPFVAPLVAGDAGPGLLLASLQGLVREVGVGQEGAADRGDVCLALRQDLLGKRDCIDPAYGDDRDAEGLLELGGDGHQAARLGHHREGPHHLVGLAQVLELLPARGPGRDDQAVDARLLGEPGDLDHRGDPQAALDVLVAADLDRQRKSFPQPGADPPDDLGQEPGPSGKVPAVLVGPQVRQRGEEGGDEVAVGAVDVHAVEPRRFGPRGRLDVRLDEAARSLRAVNARGISAPG